MAIVQAGAAWLPRSEQEVIKALIREQAPPEDSLVHGQLVLDTTTIGYLDLRHDYPRLVTEVRTKAGSRGAQFLEAVEDLVRKNQAEPRCSIPTNAVDRGTLVRFETLQDVFLAKDAALRDWLRFYEEFPNARQIIAVSRVGLDTKDAFAIVCYSIRKPDQEQGRARFEAFRREGNRWVVDRYPRLYLSGRISNDVDTPFVTLACELRYYLMDNGRSTKGLRPSPVRVLNRTGTNVICSAQAPFSLASSSDDLARRHVSGFVLQVVEPEDYAGEVLTAQADPLLDPLEEFGFGKRYELKVRKDVIGSLVFPLF